MGPNLWKYVVLVSYAMTAFPVTGQQYQSTLKKDFTATTWLNRMTFIAEAAIEMIR